MALDVGSRLGHYDVTALIGEGGMGQVGFKRDWRRRCRPVGMFVLALGVIGCAEHAQVIEHQGQILFDSGTAREDMQIYVMDPDGSHIQSLTGKRPGTISSFAAWSPDRQKIAFMSSRDGDGEVYVMAADGSDVQRLTTHRGLDGFPAWSPDGARIAFIRDTDPPATGPIFPPRSQSVYVMDADGSNVQRLTEFETGPYTSWSPNGERIAFEANLHGIWEIYVMETDGSNVQRLTHTSGDRGRRFDWSPDGQKIVFDSCLRDGNCEIYVMDADGSNVQRLTHNDKIDARPAWSPDGQRIVFHSNHEIHVMDADGGNLVRLTFNNHVDTHPDW